MRVYTAMKIELSEMDLPTDVYNLCVDLKYLSLMKVGMQPSTKSRSYTERGSIWNNIVSSVTRTISSESRSVTLNFIRDIRPECIKVIKEYPEFKDCILESISGAVKGIENIMETYREDTKICSELSTMIVFMKSVLNDDQHNRSGQSTSEAINIPVKNIKLAHRAYHSQPQHL